MDVNQQTPPLAPGWHPDPWQVAAWRWWDGTAWTMHVAPNEKKPRLPEWLSVPVILSAVLVVPMLIFLLVTTPVAVALSVVPIVIVLPVMLWLDRVEPEPRPALWHAFLWGATVAVLVASIVNSIVFVTGGETLAVVVSAPLVEETMKAGGILWAVRRREVDSVMDGIVYAGWVALGFAVVEDVTYFADAAESSQLATVFVVRALLGPFAHPLFTAWTGLAVGRAVSMGKPVFPSLVWGFALSVLSHAAWNGSLTAAASLGDSGAVVLLVGAVGFIALFFTFAIVLYRVRRKEERRLVQLVPWLAQRYGLPANEIAPFGNFSTMLSMRKALPKPQRRSFDELHAALARLAVLHDRPGGADPASEQVLIAQLQRARSGRS